MLGTENGRYDLPEDAHLFLLCRLPCPPRGTAGLFLRISRGALWRGFRCLTQIAVSPVTGMCKHRAFCDPATTAFRPSLANRIVLVSWNSVSTDSIQMSFRPCFSIIILR